MGGLFDAVILSFEVGAVKPDRSIFQRALDALGVPAARALMVGDNAVDDAGAARLGIRTLLLPRTQGVAHGLDWCSGCSAPEQPAAAPRPFAAGRPAVELV